MESSYYSENFPYRNGHLACEDVQVNNVLFEGENQGLFSSPVFIFSKKQIIQNVEEYHSALTKTGLRFFLNYSMKANANLELLKIFQDMDCSVTLVSGNELRMALEAGFDPQKMMLNGNGKRDWEIQLGIRHGCLINIDSEFDLNRISKNAEELDVPVRVLIRINPDIDPKVHPYMSTGTATSKFGVRLQEVPALLTTIRSARHVELVGFHCHLGSSILDTSVIGECAKILLDLFRRARAQGFHKLEYLNIGGGLGIDYRRHEQKTKMHPSSDPGVSGSRESLETHPKLQNEENCKETSDKITQLPTSATITQLPASATITQTPTSATITQLHTSATITQLHTSATITQLHTSDTITQLPTSATITQLPTSATITQLPTPADVISAISDIIGEEDLTLIIEPGRSLIGNAGIVAAKVIGCKENGNRRFIVTDVSMTEVIRPSLYGAYQHINLSEPSRASDDAKRVYDVVGPVCESADFIGKDRILPTPHEGCGLAVFDAGAYCGCAASNYNMRVRPAEVLVDGDSWRLIRRQETFQDLIRPYTEIQASTSPTNP